MQKIKKTTFVCHCESRTGQRLKISFQLTSDHMPFNIILQHYLKSPFIDFRKILSTVDKG